MKRRAIFRTGPKFQLLKAVEKCRATFRNSEITVISKGKFSEEEASIPVDQFVYTHEEGRYTYLSPESTKKLREKKYDTFIILYNNKYGYQYRPIERIASELNGKIWIYDSEGSFYPMKSIRWFIKIYIRRIAVNTLWGTLILIFAPLILSIHMAKIALCLKTINFAEQIKFGG